VVVVTHIVLQPLRRLLYVRCDVFLIAFAIDSPGSLLTASTKVRLDFLNAASGALSSIMLMFASGIKKYEKDVAAKFPSTSLGARPISEPLLLLRIPPLVWSPEQKRKPSPRVLVRVAITNALH
jgi:hypothetical protein